ncbi:hypothetical protein TUM22923_02730 [Polynucleobacter sp. TUM22923]|jgi:hypothetical protein|uniref:hypothetical protein n=1 Tax=Polynucleobacter sp. TUM22923 TaxID=3022126 RepID=UPI002573C464|nr:hypothetical protein [Polynucleobacter sp. TUM22923]BDX20952.1 hypothetical protein TUM22923_02730 [Polynucleobacter sp. TUM22923]
MIIAWVLSLLLLLSSLIAYIERLTALEIISATTFITASKQFIEAEKALLACEQNIFSIALQEQSACHIQSVGKGLWLISTKGTKGTPVLEVLILVDEKTTEVTRLNWRQHFE